LHLKHQLAFQKYTDNAVSKTINLPEAVTINDVDEIYKTAWMQKAKGITIFRYKSKDKQVMHRGVKYGVKGCKVCIE
jgi:ribonucleoside-diphosphate reductase alpha chain